MPCLRAGSMAGVSLMAPVALPRSLANRLLHQAQTNAQREICGLIGACSGVPADCYPVSNIASDPRREFLMDPRQQIEAMRRMRERGEVLFGIYHSHPETPPWPSESDLARAAYPGTLYLIISPGTDRAPEIRGFRLQGEKYEEVELQF